MERNLFFGLRVLIARYIELKLVETLMEISIRVVIRVIVFAQERQLELKFDVVVSNLNY